jgi:hypothetical protein
MSEPTGDSNQANQAATTTPGSAPVLAPVDGAHDVMQEGGQLARTVPMTLGRRSSDFTSVSRNFQIEWTIGVMSRISGVEMEWFFSGTGWELQRHIQQKATQYHFQLGDLKTDHDGNLSFSQQDERAFSELFYKSFVKKSTKDRIREHPENPIMAIRLVDDEPSNAPNMYVTGGMLGREGRLISFNIAYLKATGRSRAQSIQWDDLLKFL